MLLASLLILGCGDSKNRKLQQYSSLGRLTYQKQCINCHQADGLGYEKLYPPLSQADYFLENIDRSICMVKNGHDQPIMVNGQKYKLPMPAFKHLKNDEIAKVITYIGNTWGNKIGLVDEKRVAEVLENCSSK